MSLSFSVLLEFYSTSTRLEPNEWLHDQHIVETFTTRMIDS